MCHGRSRCTSKVGPGSRAHQAASIIRRDAIRAAEGGTEALVPNLKRGVSPFAGVSELQVRTLADPVITTRRVGNRDVVVADWIGGRL
jgi:hypothetical protein